MKFLIVFVSCVFALTFSYPTCPFNSVGWQSSCYFFPPYQKDAEAAENFCVSWEGHLASIHDSFLNDFLKYISEQQIANVSSRFWIGLQHFNNDYFWRDGTILDYTNWDKGQPNTQKSNDEAIFDIATGLWKTENVSTPLSFVCNINPI